MEPFAIKITARVVRLWEEKKRTYVSGFGNEAQFDHHSLGWFMLLEGSHEGIHIGKTKPALAVGDTVEIKMRKI